MPLIESFDGTVGSGLRIGAVVQNFTTWNLVNNSHEQIKVLSAVLRDSYGGTLSSIDAGKMIEIFGTEFIAPGDYASLETTWLIAPTSAMTSLWTFETETEGIMQCIFSFNSPKQCTKI